MTTSSETTQTATSESSIRFWKRSDEPARWWPWGILWLAGLLLTFLIGALITAPNIESATNRSVSEMLDRFDDVAVETDGQFVEVTATAPEAQRQLITVLARSAACSTWAGDLICPIRVAVNLNTPTVVTQKIEPRFHDFKLDARDGAVRVSGEVSAIAAKQPLLNAFSKLGLSLTDEITVSSEPSTSADLEAIKRASQIMPLLQQGQITWRSGQFSVNALVDQAAEQPVRDIVNRTEPALDLGSLELLVAEDVDRCNENFARLFRNTSIRFRTGSADIDARSNDLLAALAKEARECKGSLMVAGHTDDVGSDESNLALSQRRADAVREALVTLGVAEQRLTARGFGESAPVANNETVAGRAQNRRIVITIKALD